MSIRELIRRPLETLPVTASCADAALLMRDQRVGSVAVSEGQRLFGIVTDRDLVLRVMAEGRNARSVTLGEVMSPNPVYLPNDCSVDAALSTMRELGVRRIPTIDKEGRLDGMLAMDDVLASLGHQLGVLGAAISRVAQSEPSVLASTQHVREG